MYGNKQRDKLKLDCEQFLNLSFQTCTNDSEHDIMHSAKPKTMCSALKDFAIIKKRLIYKSFYVIMMPSKVTKASDA